MIELVIFYTFCFITIASALGVVLFKNLMHSVLSLVITLLGIAVLFVFCGAEFLAVSQIMIYAGGILILIVFGLMLTSKIGTSQSNGNNSNVITTGLIAFGIFAYFSFKIYGLSLPQNPRVDTKLVTIGKLLLSKHIFAFEAITILLIISLIGAAIISKIPKKDAPH